MRNGSNMNIVKHTHNECLNYSIDKNENRKRNNTKICNNL